LQLIFYHFFILREKAKCEAVDFFITFKLLMSKNTIIMNGSGLFFYTLLFPLLLGTARFFSILHPRLRTFFLARRGGLELLEKKIRALPPSSFRVWVHAASTGEFEQARPVIAALKAKHPEISFFVSFLSDSGYNARKDFPDASAVFYLPTDTRANAGKLISLLKPDVMLLMRYDFWPSHLLEAKKSGAKLILAAAVLQPNAQYFKPVLKSFYRKIFQLFDCIYSASDRDTESFRKVFGCRQAETAGDPRFDQVLLRSLNRTKVAHIKPFFENRTVLIAGSVWEKDEALLLPVWKELENRPSLIVVPHQVNPENMSRLYRVLENLDLPFMRVSALNDSFDPERQILVIDQTGYLAELYSLGSIAYIGGGFGVNVHNTLEPAVYGIPVLFGPRYHNSPEAEDLAASGGAAVIHDQQELDAALKALSPDSAQRKTTGKAAFTFVQKRTGATAVIAESIERVYAAHTGLMARP